VTYAADPDGAGPKGSDLTAMPARGHAGREHGSSRAWPHRVTRTEGGARASTRIGLAEVLEGWEQVSGVRRPSKSIRLELGTTVAHVHPKKKGSTTRAFPVCKPIWPPSHVGSQPVVVERAWKTEPKKLIRETGGGPVEPEYVDFPVGAASLWAGQRELRRLAASKRNDVGTA